ncbi:MAG: BatD family protein [Desulfuromusa sp.]|nr:BatD family protein [Desulfuromusa sp.]
MVNRWRTLFLLLLFSIFMVGHAMAISVQAVADRDRIAAGESLQLELRVGGHPDMEPDLSSLQKSWDILNRSQSSQMQITNGHFSRSVVYRLTLMPKTEGTVTIPAICFGANCTIPLPIDVAIRSTSSHGSTAPLLLETEVTPKTVVTQGQLVLKVRLLRRVELLDGQLNEPQPSGVAVVVKKLGNDRSYEIRRNGLLYKVIERDYAIFPQGSGTLQIPALQFDGTVADGNSRFDPFGRQGRRVRQRSQPLQVEVLPPPADLGSRPWIPATAVTLQDDWQQQVPQLVVGEPATRTLRLSARGVPAAQLPELQPALPSGFKSYPDQPRREDRLTNSGVTGLVEQKIALVPTQPGHYQLPAIDLDWWDVVSEQWQHLHLAALSVDVAPSPTVVAGSAPIGTGSVSEVAANAALPPLQKLPPASFSTVPPVGKAISPYASFWPWVSLALALGWLLTLVLLLRYRRHLQPVTEAESKDGLPTLTEKAARQAVLRAARTHDPQATRQALVQWCQILYPEAPPGVYEQFCKTVAPAGLKQELENLDLSLYGDSGQTWNGEALAEQIAAWLVGKVKQKSATLPDLYL